MKMRYLLSMAVVVGLPLLDACTPAPRTASGRLTPASRRFTDEAIAHDLAVFSDLRGRAASAVSAASGGRRYLAVRAAEWLVLAQEAYERNDRSAFPEDLLVLAERDLLALEAVGAVPEALRSAVLFPNDVRLFDDDAWGRALALRGEADRVGAPDEIARVEAMLLRQGHRILAGPSCAADSTVSRQAAALLSIVERTRVSPVPVVPDTPQVVIPRPPPVPQPDSARLPRRRGRCDAPERLSGVPDGVHFQLDSAVLAPSSRAVLDRAVASLTEYSGVRIRLSGHTDERASNAYNQALSRRRVDAVAAYLASRGLEASRIVRAEALGEEQLLSRGRDPRDHARNRRVNIVYVLCDGSELVPDESVDDLQLERLRRRSREK